MSFSIGQLETSEAKLVFALLLRDRLTLTDSLIGDVSVTSGPWTGWRKEASGTFLFLSLPNGTFDLTVRSSRDRAVLSPDGYHCEHSALHRRCGRLSRTSRSRTRRCSCRTRRNRRRIARSSCGPASRHQSPTRSMQARRCVRAHRVAGRHASRERNGTRTWRETRLPYAAGADGRFVLVCRQPPALPSRRDDTRAPAAANPDVDSDGSDSRRAATVAVPMAARPESSRRLCTDLSDPRRLCRRGRQGSRPIRGGVSRRYGGDSLGVAERGPHRHPPGGSADYAVPSNLLADPPTKSSDVVLPSRLEGFSPMAASVVSSRPCVRPPPCHRRTMPVQ